MLDASWQDRVDALGRGHYRRYDFRTSTMLGDGARLCLDRWEGDLYADSKVVDGARLLQLPSSAADLAGLTTPDDLAPLMSALVRVARDRKALGAVLAELGSGE